VGDKRSLSIEKLLKRGLKKVFKSHEQTGDRVWRRDKVEAVNEVQSLLYYWASDDATSMRRDQEMVEFSDGKGGDLYGGPEGKSGLSVHLITHFGTPANRGGAP